MDKERRRKVAARATAVKGPSERLDAMEAAFFRGLRPPPDLSIAEWAEQFRVISPEASASPGKWRNERAPYLRGIMEAIKRPETREVIIRAAAQVGKTELLLNTIGYYVHYEPCPQLVVLPTLETAEIWSKDRLAPMIRDTPVLRELVEDPKSRDSSNTISHKKFVGGHISLAGANAAAPLSQRPIRILYLDEVDRFPDSVGGEGSPITIAKKRTQNFYNRKMIACSSPAGGAETSKIHRLFEASQRHILEIPCPACKKFIDLQFSQLRWPEGQPSRAYYQCQNCRKPMLEGHRIKALQSCRWRALDKDRDGKVLGFTISALYSPWVPFGEIALEFEGARKFVDTLTVFYNLYLGEPYSGDDVTHNAASLLSRAEPFKAQVPEGVLILTAGVDVQDDRLECQVIGWGRDFECWVIDYRAFPGSPSADRVWSDLDEYLSSPREHEWGFTVGIDAVAIDTGGHYTQTVYEWVARRSLYARTYAVKGVGGERPFKQASGRINTKGGLITLWSLGVDEAKTLIYQRLQAIDPGPGYFHFNSLADYAKADYFEQLIAEQLKTVYSMGHAKKVWVLPSKRRNEALDTCVYALGALQILNPAYDQWARLNLELKEKLSARADASRLRGEPPPKISRTQVSKERSRKKMVYVNKWINSWRHR